MDAKAILRTALQKAHVAVLADQEKNNVAAMEAYTEALLLLDQVLITVDRDEDRMRIQQIVSKPPISRFHLTFSLHYTCSLS
jgi:hypothetical protein